MTDSDSEPTPSVGALDGIRVLDLGLLVQGPQAASLLCDMGAEVIKVELPHLGDQARWIPLSDADRRPPYFAALNRGKRSVTIDLRIAAGAEAFRRLVRTADVLISNFAPGVLDGWGVGYDSLAPENPRLVFGTGSLFGTEGPDAAREGADIAGQAAGGLISTTGIDGGEPTPVGVTIADHIASQNLANGILAALFARERTGRGQRVDVSLLGGQIYAQASEYTAYFLSGEVPGRANRGHPLINAAYGVVPTADGHLALVGVPPALRKAFYEAVELPELADDPRFAPLLYTAEVKQELFEILAAKFRERTTAEWADRLRAAGQRYAEVRSYDEVAADPQSWANGYFVELEHPEWGRIRAVGTPIRMSDTPCDPGGDLPELGQDTEVLLVEAGYTWDDLDGLRGQGAI